MQISKELFESIYNMKINRIDVDVYDNIWIDIDSNHLSRFDSINNFYFKCKQWALTMGYNINSGINFYGGECFITDVDNSDIIKSFINEVESEQYAVIKACEWIMERIK